MVTKHNALYIALTPSSVLAKILMVTKLSPISYAGKTSSVLAKILMVTKPHTEP